MKKDVMRRAIGGIDPRLVESADAEPVKAPRKSLGFKRVAVIALAVVLTACGLLMLNANVRAAVLGAFIWRTDDDLTVVKFSDPDSADEFAEPKTVFDATVGYVPDGFTVKEYNPACDPDYQYEESRVIDLLDETAEDPYNNAPRFVRVEIASSKLYEQKIHPADAFEDRFTPTTIRGMDAFIDDEHDYYVKALDEDEELKKQYEQWGIDLDDFDGGSIFFGDSDVMVEVSGYGLSIDELVAIAESVVW